MGESTNISWTDHTFNPWWGCWKISPECEHCYAEAFDHRLNGDHWGRTAPRKFFGDKHWSEPLRWNKAAEKAGERRRVFCASMADVFERHPVTEVDRRMDACRGRLFDLIPRTTWLDWLLLTKRPENFASMLPWIGRQGHSEPWSNVWLGVTAGVRSSLDRVAILRLAPASVRFVSCEPILEHISAADWDDVLGPDNISRCACSTPVAGRVGCQRCGKPTQPGPAPIDQLIVGDESGHGARPADPAWIRTARDAAERHGVAFHFKQWAGRDAAGISGERVKGKRHLPLLDGVQHKAIPRGR